MGIIRIIIAVCSLLAFAEMSGKRIVAYVTSWSDVMPDPSQITTINYAFGKVNRTFDGVDIDNPDRLRKIAALKKRNPELEVELSIGGWGAGGFSEMAADPDKRKAFARDCRRVADEYGLDGIDIDWEYPGSGAAGISCSPADKDNYNLLMADIRKALGSGKLLTLAAPATVGFYEFKPLMPYVDFINIMAYDLNRLPLHHSPLYRSALSGDMTADEGVRAHLAGGVPAEKIVLGVPFYGHGDREVYSDFVNYRDMKSVEGMKEMWDDVAKVPYIVDGDGRMVLSFENPRSIGEKCDYVNANGLGGVMYWEYSADTDGGALRGVVRKKIR